MMRVIRYLPAVILLALASCGDSSIFLAPVEEPAEVQVQTIAAGEILSPLSAIPVRIDRDPRFTGDPETADSIVVELFDADEVLLGEVVYESVDQAEELPPFLLDDVGEGMFVLRASYYDGDELVESSEVPFFITYGEFTILGISSFPATLFPGSSGLLTLHLATPPAADPYIEWYLDDELIRSGLRSELGTSMEIRAPDRTGAYTVSVNLYPEEPAFGDEKIPAFITHETELIVSTETVLNERDLSPERSYFVLHHFLGDVRDSGARDEMFEAVREAPRVTGDPALAVENDIFGYRLDGDDGFELDGFTLPVQDGSLSPFSLSFRLRPDTVEDVMTLLRIEAGGAQILRLQSEAEGRLRLVLDGGAMVVRTADPVLAAGTTSAVTVSVLPVDEQTVVHFYVDGLTVTSEVVAWDARSLNLPDAEEQDDDGWMLLPGRTVLAGENGFLGILDEYGVYLRDETDRPSADTEIFYTAMQQIHGDKLIYAEGFESDEIPRMVEVKGPAAIDTGRLVLGKGATAFFPLFGFSSEELIVDVSLGALPGSVLRFFAGEEETPIIDIVAADFPSDDAILEFRFAHAEDRLLVISPDGEDLEVDLSDAGDFTGIRLEVQQVGERPAEIAVESVLAWREYPEIPISLLEPETEDRTPARE